MKIDPFGGGLDDLLVEVAKAQPLRHGSRERFTFGAGEMRDADDSFRLRHLRRVYAARPDRDPV
jgi:hypothetical protein